jgi:uncharacterized membrane protein
VRQRVAEMAGTALLAFGAMALVVLSAALLDRWGHIDLDSQGTERVVLVVSVLVALGVVQARRIWRDRD